MIAVSITVAATLSAFASAARAQYVDPGAASVLLQALIAVLVGLAAVLKLYWKKITGLFGKRSRGGEG
jgi:hypothetical protein